MTKHSKYSKEQENLITYLYNKENNTVPFISKQTNIKEWKVNKVINNYLTEKICKKK